MTQDTQSTRRSFLKGGAVIAVPLAVVLPGVASAADERSSPSADEATIRALHHEWLRRVNSGGSAIDLFVTAAASDCLDAEVCGIAPDYAAAETIEIARDGKHARGRYLCQIESESRIAAHGTLAQMALAQGGGITRESKRRLVEANYVKSGERWMIARIEMRVV